jgi:hypothetical protein
MMAGIVNKIFLLNKDTRKNQGKRIYSYCFFQNQPVYLRNSVTALRVAGASLQWVTCQAGNAIISLSAPHPRLPF